jgi:hypothetical protein
MIDYMCTLLSGCTFFNFETILLRLSLNDRMVNREYISIGNNYLIDCSLSYNKYIEMTNFPTTTSHLFKWNYQF